MDVHEEKDAMIGEPVAGDSAAGIRLQVFLSHNGVCSRREAMDIIKRGEVTVNDMVVREPSVVVDPQADRVCVKDQVVKAKAFSYVLLYKPSGYVTTRVSQQGQRTVFDLLPQKLQHLVPVGRLDKDTEGLLLLTNDGDLTYAMTHPRFELDKTYFVRASGALTLKDRQIIERGIILDGRRTAPAFITVLDVATSMTTARIVIHEGRKRQVRRMFGARGYNVVFLKREKQGPIELKGLLAGNWRFLAHQELVALRAACAEKSARPQGARHAVPVQKNKPHKTGTTVVSSGRANAETLPREKRKVAVATHGWAKRTAEKNQRSTARAPRKLVDRNARSDERRPTGDDRREKDRRPQRPVKKQWQREPRATPLVAQRSGDPARSRREAGDSGAAEKGARVSRFGVGTKNRAGKKEKPTGFWQGAPRGSKRKYR